MKNHFTQYITEPFASFKKTKNIAKCSMIIALSVVVSYLTTVYPSEVIKISFSFIFVAIAAMEFGPIIGGSVAAISDIVSFISRPMGTYMPMLTITNFVSGMIFGFLLYKNKAHIWRIITSRSIIVVVINLLVDTYFLSLVYTKKTFWVHLWVRVIEKGVFLPIEIIILIVVLKAVLRINKNSSVK